MPILDRFDELKHRELNKKYIRQAEDIYNTQFYSNKHSKLRKWLIVKLIKFQLRFKK